MAFVVLRPGANCTGHELIAYCEQHMLERAAIPKRIEILGALPLTAVGKIFRPALRQQITETVLREVLLSNGIAATITGSTDKQRGLMMSVSLTDKRLMNAAQSLLEPYALAITIA
jgi:fatty-acyl-CoA synthase